MLLHIKSVPLCLYTEKPLSQTCSGTANCSDFCRVENGQEVCFCRPGFTLASDNSSCEGKSQAEVNKSGVSEHYKI